MTANMEKCRFYLFIFLLFSVSGNLTQFLINIRQIQHYYCCALMRYFMIDVTVVWLGYPFTIQNVQGPCASHHFPFH